MFINDIFKKRQLNEGGFDIPEIPRAPQPKPVPNKDKTVDEDRFDKDDQTVRLPPHITGRDPTKPSVDIPGTSYTVSVRGDDPTTRQDARHIGTMLASVPSPLTKATGMAMRYAGQDPNLSTGEKVARAMDSAGNPDEISRYLKKKAVKEQDKKINPLTKKFEPEVPNDAELDYQGSVRGRFPHYYEIRDGGAAFELDLNNGKPYTVEPGHPEWDTLYKQYFDLPTPNDYEPGRGWHIGKNPLAEAGPFSSTEPKKPRKGSVADLAAQKRKEQERGKQPVEPRDQMVGVARVVKDVAEGFLGDRTFNRVMPMVKRIAGEVSDYDRDEFGEELWSLLDQKYGPKFAQSVLQDELDFYWNEYTELTGQDLAEGSIYKKDQDLSSIPTQELEAFVRKHWFGGVPTYGQGESVKRAIRELRRREKQGVAESISVVDQDYDLDQMHLILDIEGKKVSFTYWDYEEDFSNAERRDVFDQLQKQPWYAKLDHPTRMEILDAAYRAIRGLEPQEYRPTVRDEPLDEQGVAEGSAQEKLYKRHQELRKKRGAPDPEYYKEFGKSYDIEDDQERYARQAELKKKYGVTNEDVDQYIEELGRAGYEMVTESATLCPECGGAAYADRMLAEKQDACYHKVKSRYKVWPSAYASGALVRCRKVGAKNWGNKSKK